MKMVEEQNMKKKLVMIGNGMAGVRCMEEILKRDREAFEITIIGDEPHPNYNRIMLSNVLQGKNEMNDINMNEWDWYENNQITLYTDEKVIEIVAEKRRLKRIKGEALSMMNLSSLQAQVHLFYQYKDINLKELLVSGQFRIRST